MQCGRLVALAMALCALFAATTAAGAQEARLMGSEVRLRVEASGVASVENFMRWRVARGPLKSLDIVNIFPAAIAGLQATATSEEGRELATRLIRLDVSSLRVVIDDPHPPTRGSIAVNLQWQVDLASAGALVKSDSSWRLAWSAPVAENGFDSAKTVIDLPAAPEPPLAILADTGSVDNGADTNLVREPGRDILELVRPHVARGEAVRSTVRVDSHAFAQSPDSRTAASDESKALARRALTGQLFTTVGIGILALAFGFLVDKKTRWFGIAYSSHRSEAAAPGLLPLPPGLRGPLAGVAFAAGLEMQVLGRLTAGTALVASAALCAALSPPMLPCRARGPARWLVLRPQDAFSCGTSQGDRWLGLGAAAECLILLLLTALLVTISCRVSCASAYRPWVGAMNCVVLIPLLATGRASQLPPRATPATKRWLSSVLRHLKRVDFVQVAPWARVTLDGAVDELRLLAMPRAAVPGVVGIEVGFAWTGTPVGWIATPRVLVRFLEDSCAAVKLALALPSARAIPGRRAEEKVILLTPLALAGSATVALVRMLTLALAERRATAGVEWGGPERRVAQGAIAV